MDIDIETLQARWSADDARLDEVLRINRKLVRTIEQGQVRTSLQRFGWSLWFQIAINAVAAIALGLFMAQHYTEPRFLVPAIALHLYVVIALVTAVRQLVMLGRIDHDLPVTEVQQRLETLRAFRIRLTIGIILSAMLLWVPVYIVLLEGVFGVNVYDWLPMWFFILNIGVGAVLIPVALWVSRRYADALSAQPFVQHVMRDLAGKSFNDARDQLAALAAFEREDR